MSEPSEHDAAQIAAGYVRFRVSVPDRPELPELDVLAPDESTAWAKYRVAVGRPTLPNVPSVKRAT